MAKAISPEAIRLARMDAAAHIADPLFVEVPLVRCRWYGC